MKIKYKRRLNMLNLKATLEDTIDLMKSSDYKERFKAEYYQVKFRYEKLF